MQISVKIEFFYWKKHKYDIIMVQNVCISSLLFIEGGKQIELVDSVRLTIQKRGLNIMDSRFNDFCDKLRQLLSEVQGAPYPATINNELYDIWYEHIQSTAIDCFEYLNENFPQEAEDISRNLDRTL